MKKLLLVIFSCALVTSLYATGGTHYVRPHVKRNGSIVQGHRAANPKSGVHCKSNNCR